MPVDIAKAVATPTSVSSATTGPNNAPPAGDGRRVLVVEDDPIGQRVTTHLVRRLGYAVDVATGGQEAIDAAATDQYALVLMDCQMPGIDGYMATAAIRQREAVLNRQTETVRRLPIIALTASTLGTDRNRSLAAGMDEYLTKPIDERQLGELLARWTHAPNEYDALTSDNSAGAGHPVGGLVPTRRPHADYDTPAANADGTIPPILDPAALFGRGGQPRTEHREIVELFLRETPRRLEALRDAAQGGDRDQVARRAHTLAGSASSLGALRLAAACALVERLARAEASSHDESTGPPAGADLTPVAAAIGDIPAAFAELEAVLRSHFLAQ